MKGRVKPSNPNRNQHKIRGLQQAELTPFSGRWIKRKAEKVDGLLTNTNPFHKLLKEENQ